MGFFWFSYHHHSTTMIDSITPPASNSRPALLRASRASATLTASEHIGDDKMGVGKRLELTPPVPISKTEIGSWI